MAVNSPTESGIKALSGLVQMFNDRLNRIRSIYLQLYRESTVKEEYH